MASIEENLERIASALEKIAAGVGEVAGPSPEKKEKPAARRGRKPPKPPVAEKPAAAPPAPSEEPPAASPVTRDQVREAFRIWRKTHEKAEAVKVLDAHGAKSISGADEGALPALLKAFSEDD